MIYDFRFMIREFCNWLNLKCHSKNILKINLSFLIALMSFATAANAQITPAEKNDLSARFFGDYYWFVKHHNTDIEGNNGFWVRRVYLTYDHQISESLSGRIRLEMQSAGDFTTNSALTAEVKDAWLRYEFGQHEIMAGIAPTPTFELVEEVWDYRAIAKTPLDLQDVGSSRGLGISIRGKIGDAKRFGYHFMIANGNGSKTELNQGKKFMLSLSYELSEHLVIQAYGDYESTDQNEYLYTLQGFLGYQSDVFNIGGLYAYHWRSATTTTLNIVSLFTNFDITKNLRGYLRIDHTLEPNPSADEIDYILFSDEAQLTYLTGGVEIQLHPQVSLLPNVQAVFYGETNKNTSPETDFIARFTLAFTL